MDFSVQLFKKDKDRYIAFSPKFNLYAEGKTLNKAVKRLQEIIGFYLASANELGVSPEELCFPHQRIEVSTQPQHLFLEKNLH